MALTSGSCLGVYRLMELTWLSAFRYPQGDVAVILWWLHFLKSSKKGQALFEFLLGLYLLLVKANQLAKP